MTDTSVHVTLWQRQVYLVRPVTFVRHRIPAAPRAGASSEQDVLARALAHELRGALGSLDGFLRVLERGHAAELSPEARRFIGLARSSAHEMSRVLAALTDFTRLGSHELRPVDIDVDELVECVVGDFAEAVDEAGTEMRLGHLPRCTADPVLLERMFSNLVSNAIRFSRDSDMPVVEIGADDDAFFVRDNGVGFDPAEAPRLFGMFQRLHAGGGVGAGLAIARRIVERHGGRMWAEGVLGGGATFWFTLPGAAS